MLVLERSFINYKKMGCGECPLPREKTSWLERRAIQEVAHRAIVFPSECSKVSGTCTDDCSSETNGEDFPGSYEGRLEDSGHWQRPASGYHPVGSDSFPGE